MNWVDDWREQALCKQINCEFWYPPMESDSPEQYYSIGREVCFICPVWEKCLEEGKKETWGMWGGLTPNERSVFYKDKVKKTALKNHGTNTRYRQGCQCDECVVAHNTRMEKQVFLGYLPQLGEPIDDLSKLRFSLLIE